MSHVEPVSRRTHKGGRHLAVPLMLLLSGGGAAALPVPIDVPRMVPGAVVIDGVHEPEEWRRSVEVRLSDRSTVRLQHDGQYLYIAISGANRGFASLCSARGDTVKVLHASAALGAVTYTRNGADWRSPDTAFTYSMRSTDTTATGKAERRAYLERHGWVSTTVNMGRHLTHEMQIALDRLDTPPRIALGYFRIAGPDLSVLAWPESLPAAEGCIAQRLVSGYVPPNLQFRPADWAELRLAR
jgi:hypothetical protein